MASSIVLGHTVLVITAAVLFYAAWNDLRRHRIPNELVAVLAGLFVVHAILSGRWTGMHWNIAFAFLMFLVMLVFYIRKTMGGGDLKLLTVGFLWAGYACALPFAIFGSPARTAAMNAAQLPPGVTLPGSTSTFSPDVEPLAKYLPSMILPPSLK